MIITISRSTSISYADRVVAFIQQPSLFDILKRNNVQLSSKQRDKLNMVRQNGRAVYDRMSSDIDMASVVSQIEELIMSFVVLANTRSSSTPTTTPTPQTSVVTESTSMPESTPTAAAAAPSTSSGGGGGGGGGGHTTPTSQLSSQLGKNLR